MKETLEEAAKNYTKTEIGLGFYPDIEIAFEKGAKWQQEQAERHFENKDWAEVNSILLVNFLRMPDAHKIHLLVSIKERRPDLFESKPETEMKQETLEEAAEKYVKTKWEPAQEENRESFIDGAKWQQEELEKELNRFFLYLRNSGEHFIGVPNEQFVKKYLEGK